MRETWPLQTIWRPHGETRKTRIGLIIKPRLVPEPPPGVVGHPISKVRATLDKDAGVFTNLWHDFQKHQLSTLFEMSPSSMLLDHVRLNLKNSSLYLQPVLDILEGHRWRLGVSRQLQPNAIAISGCSVPSLHNRISFFFPSGLQVGLPPELQAASHLTHWIVL